MVLDAASYLNDMQRLPSPPPPMNDMSSLSALYKLLTQASSLPCSSGAAAFVSLVPIENNWIPLALDALLPILQDQNIQIPQRILATYLLHDLFHDQQLNPFHEHLLRIFDSEKAAAVLKSKSLAIAHSLEVRLSSPQEGGGGGSDLQAENEQLVWVLWKILKGEGEDLAPYSPNILSRTALPEHLRALHLIIQSAQNHSPHMNMRNFYSSTTEMPPLASTATFHNLTTSFELDPPMPASATAGTSSSSSSSSSSSFSPFDNDAFTAPRSHQYQNSQGDGATEGWLHDEPSNVHQGQYQLPSDFLRNPYTHTHSARSNLDFEITRDMPSSSPNDLRFPMTVDGQRQALLRAINAESAQTGVEELLYLRGGVAGNSEHVGGRSGINRGDRVGYVPSQAMQGTQTRLSPPQHSPVHSRSHAPLNLQPQVPSSPLDSTEGVVHRHQDFSPIFNSFPTSINTTTTARPKPGPIARPHPAPSLYYNSATPHDPTPAPSFANGFPPQQAQIQVPDGFAQSQYGFLQQTQAQQASGLLQRTQTSAPPSFSQQTQLSAPKQSSQPTRTPGVIGSGRPSSKNISPVATGSPNGLGDRHSPAGVFGNGRPAMDAHEVPEGRNINYGIVREEERDVFMPRSAARGGKSSADVGRQYFGAIGRPKQVASNPREKSSEGRSLAPSAPSQLASKIIPELPQATTGGSNSHLSRSPTEPTVSSPTAILHSEKTPEPSAPAPEKYSIPNISALSLENGSRSDLQQPTSSRQYPPISTSPSTSAEGSQHEQLTGISHLPPVHAATLTDATQSKINEKERDELSRAIVLLLNARERVLTLPEQRWLTPHLLMLTRPLSLLRPGDLPPLIAKNPDVAAKLLVLLLDRKDEESTRVERVLRDVGENDLLRVEHESHETLDNIQSAVEFIGSYGARSTDSPGSNKVSPFGGREAREGYLDALRKLPPTMQSFNLIARLLRPTHLGAASDPTAAQPVGEEPEVRTARLVREEVLGGLVSGCVQWIEKADREEKEGEVLDDRVAVSVSSLSRFYSSLLKHGFVSASSEVDTTEIMSFALQFSRFEEARSLYSTLAAARA